MGDIEKCAICKKRDDVDNFFIDDDGEYVCEDCMKEKENDQL